MVFILIGALVIGLALGMLGSGGSAITVPVLIYLVGHDTKESIAESMAIVGLISAAIAIPYAQSKQVDWRSVLYFGIPGMLGTFGGAWLGGHAASAIQLTVFGGVLLAAAWAMLRKPEEKSLAAAEDLGQPPQPAAVWKIALEGTGVGILTGFVGVGGGFLIVPALVVLGKLPMRLAIGSSLVIIAAKAAVGFAQYEHYLVTHESSVNWLTILMFTLLGIAGSFFGKAISNQLNQDLLKKVFAGFLVVLGGFLMIQESVKWARSDRSTARSSAHVGAHLTHSISQPISLSEGEK